jgi:acylpyruvate hydrolase
VWRACGYENESATYDAPDEYDDRETDLRLATVRTGSGTRAARLDGDQLVLLNAPDVGAILSAEDRDAALVDEQGTVIAVADAKYATLIPRPPKVICVGMNYREHIAEMGREPPDFPTLFAKYSTSLIGANDDIVLPSASMKPDWEAELGVVIGESLRRAGTEEALDGIAGFTVVNDISMRDWQRRTPQSTRSISRFVARSTE